MHTAGHYFGYISDIFLTIAGPIEGATAAPDKEKEEKRRAEKWLSMAELLDGSM